MCEQVEERIRRTAVDVLVEVDSLWSSEDREQFLSLVLDGLRSPGRLSHHAAPRNQYIALLRLCLRGDPAPGRPGGLTCLATVLELMDPGSPEAATLSRLADEWQAVRTLPAEFLQAWDLLEEALLSVPLTAEERGRLVRGATLSRLRRLPDHCTTPWSDFLHLVGQNTAPRQVPPWMVYLDKATEWMSQEHRGELRALNRRRAARWELGETFDRRRYDSTWAGPQLSAVHDENLAIRIRPAPFDEDHYTVSHWFHSDARSPHFEGRRDSAVIPFAALQQTVSDVISEVERAEGDRPGRLRLEFVLPLELINLPVESWPLDAEDPHLLLGTAYPAVVIRSLDRLLDERWHRRWRLRWQKLKDEPTSSSWYVSIPDRDPRHHEKVLAGLLDERQVAAVLSEPPERSRQRGCLEIKAALRTGYPVVVWHRTSESTAEFRQALSDLFAGGFADLLSRITRFRQEAAALGSEHDHFGRHLAVLWDDPDRKPL
ncbi:VMAP-C domain-containing protein [Streptomyces lincolnensis]|uniref:VMAP-C domain-containing protein n=1 Tax=Streptomyces lincolnensis TaxID=1915 RepID=UPI0037CF2B52